MFEINAFAARQEELNEKTAENGFTASEVAEEAGLNVQALEGLRKLTGVALSHDDDAIMGAYPDILQIAMPTLGTGGQQADDGKSTPQGKWTNVEYATPSRRTVINELLASSDCANFIDAVRAMVSSSVIRAMHSSFREICDYEGGELQAFRDEEMLMVSERKLHDAVMELANSIAESYVPKNKNELDRLLKAFEDEVEDFAAVIV